MGKRRRRDREASDRLFWKVLVIVLSAVAITAVVAGSIVGLALRSGSLAIPEFATWMRFLSVYMFISLLVGGLLARAGFIEDGVRLPVVRAAFPLLAFSLGLLFTGTEASKEFFSTSAEVIPILLLALAIEGRAFSLEEFRSHHWLGRELLKVLVITTMFVMASGEAFALVATTQHHPSPLFTGIVAGALAAGVASVMLFSVGGLFMSTRS